MANVAMVHHIKKLLIVNRGEIARRIMRSAHNMGISTVAVYADGDINEPFVREADQAVSLDGSRDNLGGPLRQCYLSDG